MPACKAKAAGPTLTDGVDEPAAAVIRTIVPRIEAVP